jgi:transposase
VDRRKYGSKHALVTDAEGVPLKPLLASANTTDTQILIPLVDAIPPVAGKVGHPRRRPAELYGDRGFDCIAHRERLRDRHIRPKIAWRCVPSGSGLGVYRWVVERTISWLHQFRRLRIRFERRPEIHEALLSLGCSLICWNYVGRLLC